MYTHSVHCTIVIADCGPVTLIGKRGVVHFFSLFSAPFFFLFLCSWRKNVSVLPDQNCHVITTLSSECTRIPCGYEKKKYKVYCLIFLCVDIMTENCEK